MISTKPAVISCFCAILLWHFSCSRFGEASDLSENCDIQAQKLHNWLDDFRKYYEIASCGISLDFKDAIELDDNGDLSSVRCLPSFYVYNDHVVDYEYSTTRLSNVSKFIERSANKLVKKKRQDNIKGRENKSTANENFQVNLFIAPNAPWILIVDTIQGFARAGITDVYFIFDSNRELVTRPPNTSFHQKLHAKRKRLENKAKPDEHIVSLAKGASEIFRDYPKIAKIFEEISFADEFEKIYWLKKHLPAAMKATQCNPPFSHIQSVIWHLLWKGKVRLGKLVKVSLPGTADCHEVAQDGSLLWNKAYKAALKAVKEHGSNSICFTARGSE